jgi:ABC-type uncharacterized transport system ATPase subunit
MSLVMQVCEDIYVLDFGELLYQGSPELVMRSEIVRSAYLGDDDGADRLVEAKVTEVDVETPL